MDELVTLAGGNIIFIQRVDNGGGILDRGWHEQSTERRDASGGRSRGAVAGGYIAGWRCGKWWGD